MDWDSDGRSLDEDGSSLDEDGSSDLEWFFHWIGNLSMGLDGFLSDLVVAFSQDKAGDFIGLGAGFSFGSGRFSLDLVCFSQDKVGSFIGLGADFS